jgi:hypothetical protein
VGTGSATALSCGYDADGQPEVQAISTGRTVFCQTCPKRSYSPLQRDEEHLRLIADSTYILAVRTFDCAGLDARGCRVRHHPRFGPQFHAETVELVEDLALVPPSLWTTLACSSRRGM